MFMNERVSFVLSNTKSSCVNIPTVEAIPCNSSKLPKKTLKNERPAKVETIHPDGFQRLLLSHFAVAN